MKELPTTDERAERCETCRWWDANDVDDTENGGGCRRYPPTINHAALMALVLVKHEQNQGDPDENEVLHEQAWYPNAPQLASFPETYDDDFCGEWAAKPEGR